MVGVNVEHNVVDSGWMGCSSLRLVVCDFRPQKTTLKSQFVELPFL